MSLKIFTENNKVLLEYSPVNGIDWINEKFERNEILTIKKTFFVSKQDLLESEEENGDSILFIIGELDDDYYTIYNNVLGNKYNVLFHISFSISIKAFIVNSNYSIFSKFEKLADQPIIIGGDRTNSIPDNVFKSIIDSFPTTTELNHYLDSRITNVLTQYLEGVKDSGSIFERYLDKRNKIEMVNSIPSIRKYEYEKYLFILENIRNMIKNCEVYSEEDWKKQIIEIVLILYPKYIKCFSEVEIKDFYTDSNRSHNRYIDLMLVDANGNIDVIEIKRPSDNSVITKNVYRGNFTPMKELSCTIMQVEKYLFHLSKWGVNGEKLISLKYQDKLPNGLSIKITNPKGIVILGRDNNLSVDQKFDFEIIKRKYSNVMDIITYDDLIRRLENVLDKFRNE